MCLICVEFQKDKLSIQEARSNLWEMTESLGSHAQEVEDLIDERELEELINNMWGEQESWEGDTEDFDILELPDITGFGD